MIEKLNIVSTVSSTLTKRLIIALVVMSFVGGIGSGVAMTMNSMNEERISIFEGDVVESDFVVADSDVEVRGKNLVVNTLVLENTDSVSHSANVTVYVEDDAGNVIATESKLTGDVAANSTIEMDYRFQQKNIANEYSSTFVVIDQQD